MAELPFKTVKAMKTHLFKVMKKGLNRRTGSSGRETGTRRRDRSWTRHCWPSEWRG